MGRYRFIRPEPQALWTPRLADWDADGEFVPGSDEDGGGRWQFDQPVPREGWPLALGRRPLHRAVHPVPPPRLLPRHGAGVGLDGRAAGRASRRADAQPVRLHRRRHAGAVRLRPGHPRRCLEEVGRPGARERRAVGHGRSPDPLDGRRCRQVRRARGAARQALRRDHPRSAQVRPRARRRGLAAGGASARPRRRLPRAARCRQPLPVPHRLCRADERLALAGLLAEHFADLPGTIEHGDLAVREEGEGGRLLPTAIFARWRNP